MNLLRMYVLKHLNNFFIYLIKEKMLNYYLILLIIVIFVSILTFLIYNITHSKESLTQIYKDASINKIYGPNESPKEGDFYSYMELHRTEGDPSFYSYMFDISNKADVIYSISNLPPNFKVSLIFTDYYFNMMSDKDGILYFNNKHEALPMLLLPYNDVIIELEGNNLFDYYKKIDDKIFNSPIAHYGILTSDERKSILLLDEVPFVIDTTLLCPNKKNVKYSINTIIKEGNITIPYNPSQQEDVIKKCSE